MGERQFEPARLERIIKKIDEIKAKQFETTMLPIYLWFFSLVLYIVASSYWESDGVELFFAGLLGVFTIYAWRNDATALKKHRALRASLQRLRVDLKTEIMEIEDFDQSDESQEAQNQIIVKPAYQQLPAEVRYPVAFGEDKRYPVEHRRLNNFAGITCITFSDVLTKLDIDRQKAFPAFYARVKVAIDDLHLDPSTFFQVPDEFTALRFLQADDYDEDKAIARLVQCVKWRISFGVDEFLSHPNQKIINRYRRLRVRRVVGIDKTGCPLIVERLGEFIASEESFKGGLTMDQWLLCYAYDVSEVSAAFREATERTGKYWHRTTYIGDLKGAKIGGAFRLIPCLKLLTSSIERNFPEFAGNLILINAPAFAFTLWTIVRRFLDPKTASKISILIGPSPDVLQKLCGETALPVEYGGTNPYVVPHPLQRMDEEFQKQYPLE